MFNSYELLNEESKFYILYFNSLIYIFYLEEHHSYHWYSTAENYAHAWLNSKPPAPGPKWKHSLTRKLETGTIKSNLLGLVAGLI